MRQIIFHPIGLGNVPNYAEFSEVVHSAFRSRNILIVYREIAENRFPWKFRKFKILHFNPFPDCFRGKNCPWSRIFSFPDIRNYRTAGIYRILTEKFREKFFFCIFVNSVSIKVFEVADSEFCGFRLIRIMIFRKIAEDYGFPDNCENTKFIGKFREEIFFYIFVNSHSLKVFVVANSEFCGFRLIRIMIFWINAKIPNLTVNAGRNYFFILFG